MFGKRSGRNSELRLILIDFVLAFAVIWLVVFTVGVARGRAHAEGVSTIGALVRTMARENLASAGVAAPDIAPDIAPDMATPARKRTDAPRLPTYLLLSLSVAAMAALNLAFWRHLRRAYASPRLYEVLESARDGRGLHRRMLGRIGCSAAQNAGVACFCCPRSWRVP
jgi:hypothetical protein